MKQTVSQQGLHLGSVILGAVGGGIVVMIATKAIPTMLANFLSAMMGKMMSHMEEGGGNQPEMCQKMMSAFAEAPKA